MLSADRFVSAIKAILPSFKESSIAFTDLFIRFQQILEGNNSVMEIIADMEDKQSGQYVFDSKYMEDMVSKLEKTVLESAYNFNFITQNKYFDICHVVETMAKQLRLELSGKLVIPSGKTVLPLTEIKELMHEEVGNKAYNLFRAMNLPQVRVPLSFVVSIRGFQKFMAFNNLYDKINALMAELNNGASTETISSNIRLSVLNGDIPSDLREEILQGAAAIYPKNPEAGIFSVRSSAASEDDVFSFAGLYDSYLNVPYRDLLSSYKKVVASMYSVNSLEYRLNNKMPMTDMAMAVLYQEMMASHVSGVVYTVDPNFPQEQVCVLGANWGLGKAVVEGSAAVDNFRISRESPHTIVEQRINEKKWKAVSHNPPWMEKVPYALRNRACLTLSQLEMIVETALIIERFFKRPLDIEWCLNEKQELTILQARPLSLPRGGQARSVALNAILKKQKILVKEKGIIAYRGVGIGPVWLASEEKSLDNFPSGAVLVARFGIPILSRVIPRASAVITDVGSPTGHMATVAREFHIPTIVDAGCATQMLEDGREITVDAERNVIYDGRINELLHHYLLERSLFEVRYEYQILRRMLRRISPLTLVDPEDSNFTVKGCRTFHDVIRFMHEKSIEALLKIVQKPSSLLARGGKRLKSELPLNLLLIDIGGGISEKVGKGGWVLPDEIESQPMKALWKGMSSEDSWSTEPAPADFKGFMSGVTRTQSSVVAGQVLTGLNIAVLGGNYMNLTLRVGYHFTTVDAFLGQQPENNKVFFRFVGGATDISRRSRRAALLVNIMEAIGFKVEWNGDLVIARAVNSSANQIKSHLYLIGRLIGFVRQLDIQMTDDASVDRYFRQFMTANNIGSTYDQQSNRSDTHDK